MKIARRAIVAAFVLAFSASSYARTLEETACEEAKLGRLIHRFATFADGDNLFLWSTGGNAFSGLAASHPIRSLPQGGFVRDERQLAFSVALERSADLLNPRRQPLPQITLTRRGPSSNLSKTGVVMAAMLELAPVVVDPQEPTQGLVIAGRLGADYGTASGASRALEADDLFERCPGDNPSEFDLQVFEILARTVRATEALAIPGGGRGLFRYKAILFPDVEPLTYRVKVFLYYTVCNRDDECPYSEVPFQLRVHMALDADGRLAPGRIEALPWCLPGVPPPCTEDGNPGTAVIVAPPIFAGHETQLGPVFQSGAFLNLDYDTSESNILTDDVPWPDLLRGTAWDRPLGAASP